jgi:hypothetical protein
VRFEAVAGHGEDFAMTADSEGGVSFTLSEPFAFALYKYDY